MARVCTYLNFQGATEAAFEFYRSVFGTSYAGNGIMRMGDIPLMPGQPPVPEKEKNWIMHVCLPTLGEHQLMGTDTPESMGKLNYGNNISIMLQPDTRDETGRLFAKLAEGGTIDTPLQEMFWGDYFGSVTDKFGVPWMFNCPSKN